MLIPNVAHWLAHAMNLREACLYKKKFLNISQFRDAHTCRCPNPLELTKC